MSDHKDMPDAGEFELMVRRAGLSLSDAQTADLKVGYGHIKAMAARVRGAGKRPREAEPAMIFKAKW